MCNGKANLTDFYHLKSSKSLLRVHRVGNLDKAEHLLLQNIGTPELFKRNILPGGRGKGE